jgi:hypothetical protein
MPYPRAIGGEREALPVRSAAGETPPETALSPEDREALRRAVHDLEAESFVSRVSALAGSPIAIFGRALPDAVSGAISKATSKALERALHVALRTVPKEGREPETRLNKALAALSGAMGGALGFSAVLLELPISTVIMLRAIASIAQSEGEDLSKPETALACIEVFSLGGHSGSAHLHESGYFAVRAALARSMSQAIRHIAERGVVDEVAAAVVRLLSQIASRFGVAVSQKVAAQAVPVIGALGGAAVNAAFTDHFQTLARGHFTVRRLERAYGKAVVRAAYERIRTAEGLA